VWFNFIGADRDQMFLLPPDVRDWLPADHLVWFVVDVVDVVDEMDLLASSLGLVGHVVRVCRSLVCSSCRRNVTN
jgi:hypothetical protein